MEKILQNLALIDLIKYCKEKNIDPSGTHLEKAGRGFRYSLVNDRTGKNIVTVFFYKNGVPTHLIY